MTYYLLTNTCYGTRLPGDRRGFVGRVREHRPNDPPARNRVVHNVPGTEPDADAPGLEQATRALLKGPPIRLTAEQAAVVAAQFQETAAFRRWDLHAVAVMHDHFHVVVGVPDEAVASRVLADFKAWAGRRLNERFGRPPSDTWWTESGSKQHLPDDRAVGDAVVYVIHRQPDPLAVFRK